MAIKCPKCNADNPDTSRFCADCGTQIVSIEDVSVTKTIQKPAKGFKKDTIIAKKYKIIEKIGEGGMGVVYKAKDTRLNRTVALKFLPSELTQDEEAKKRFIQEAQAAAALNYPQICTVFEIDEADNQTFISMEYIEGQSLKDKLKEGPLSIDEAKDIAIQVAEGFKEAHEKGIVHRDIKPANIMLTKKGLAKITDFGLAKLSWGADLTKPSTIMGTVAYMSPEQAKGEEVDYRTDIWSLGAMLYEMLTNERPFKKDKEHALIHEILNEEPEPITSLHPDIPRHIEEVVHKALAKDVGSRLQTMNDFIQNLKHSLPIILPKAECSIVVLPFEDMSPNKDNEYFSDGLTEEIITDLSQIHELCVISRNSAMALKGTKKNTKTIGHELNVQYVLEGSVRKAGNNLRITAQLIDARTDVHLWARKYSGTMDDVFDIQEKVSRFIVDALKIKLTPEENERISERPYKDVQAFDCYLKAQQEFFRFTEEGFNRAIRLIQNGLEIVGENELLYEAMGNAYFQQVNFLIKSDKSYLQKAEEWAKKLLDLNPNSSRGYFLNGLIQWKLGNWKDGIGLLRKSLTIDLNNPRPLEYLVYLYAIAGKGFISRALLPKLLEIDPLTPLIQSFPGWIEYMEGHFEAALVSIRKMYQMEPENPFYSLVYANFLTRIQSQEEAFSVIDRLAEKAQQTSFAWFGLFRKFALQGKRKEALELVTPEFTKIGKWDEQMSWEIAASFALIEEKDKALDWLKNAIDRGLINYPFLNEYDPLLENIRGEPRFKKLMERVKHEWENFEV